MPAKIKSSNDNVPNMTVIFLYLDNGIVNGIKQSHLAG